MRRSAAIFLLVLFLFSALLPVPVKEELAKLPSLLEHFQEHKLETPELGFLQFLQIHYGAEFASHHSAHDHSDLPMKSSCDHVHLSAPLVLPGPAIPKFCSIAATVQLPHFSDQVYHFLLLHDIWQPPQA